VIGDLWNAVRSLWRTRRVTTLAVIATIGIVLGGVTMIFGLVNAVLLRPLPYPDADRLATVRLNDRAVGLRWFMPFPLFEQLSSRVRGAEGMAAFRPEAVDLQSGQWQVVQAAVATVNLFEVLGARPVLGRHFLSDDDRVEGDEPVILSEALWRRAFAAERTALYDISPRDPLTLTSAALVSLAVALGAAYAPARAVSDADVIQLLRAE
jgi:hypothetical protein